MPSHAHGHGHVQRVPASDSAVPEIVKREARYFSCFHCFLQRTPQLHRRNAVPVAQCARDIELRALIVWQNFRRVLFEGGAPSPATIADDLKDAVDSYADTILAEAQTRYQTQVKNIGFGQHRSLADARDQALNKVYAEIDLYALGLNTRNESRQSHGNPGMVFNAPVGAVLTGPSATANIFQTITLPDRDALLAAVDLLKKGLANVETLPAHPKEEILELVEEAETETRKEKPNNSRLLMIFTTVATAIQAVGSLKPAYDALKMALIPFGIQLP